MKEIIKHRFNLLKKAKDKPELQSVEIELCKRDILYFFKNYLYTDKNKTMFSDDLPSKIPFVPFPFQDEFITEVWESIVEGNKPIKERNPEVLTNVFIEKSRQMGISWLMCGIFLYGFIFHKHKYTIISRSADEVDKMGDMDSMFEKIRFMIRNLPKWMLPQGFSKEPGKNSTNAFMNISDTNSQASITGKTANPDAGRGGTRNAIFMDEMASMQYAHEINMAAGNNTPCRIFNSTPNGEGNEFYRMRILTQWRKDDNGDNIPPEIKGLRYHRTEHTLYDDDWYKWRIQGMSKEQIAQELEIDYHTAIIGRVYPEFPKEPVILTYDMNKPLYISIDNSHGGSDPNALIVIQPENHYRNIIDCIELFVTPEDCANYLAEQPKFIMNRQQEKFLERYKTYNWRRAIFISDPYDTKSAMGNSTILEDYKKVGINLLRPKDILKSSQRIVNQINKTRSNMYKLRYNDNCLDFASAILNAKYPERRENSNATSENNTPIHNWTSHYRTALEYFMCYVLENPMSKKKKHIKDTRPMRNYITGELVYKQC